MALINFPADHIKLRKTLSLEKKSLMLKDYLRDDLGSCSSSGFKSFPRRQCCTTIRFLLEADLKKSKHNYSSATKRLLKRSRSKPGSSTTISALQRASESVLKAIKLLPFPFTKSSPPSSSQSNSCRKLFKRGFWRKSTDKEDHGRGGGEIKRWKLFSEFLEEKNQPSYQNTIPGYNTTDTCSTRVSPGRSSNRWAESEFTANNLQSWSGHPESWTQNDTVSSKTTSPEEKNVSNRAGVTVAEDSKEDWAPNGGKEQFSPVSVLDCPFDDEEVEDNGSAFEDHLARVEVTKQKLMQKIRRFERLAQLEPVELDKRIAMAELEDEFPDELLGDYNNKPETNHQKLYKLLKPQIPSNSFSSLSVNAKRVVIEMGTEDFGKNENWMELTQGKEEVGSAVELALLSSLLDDFLIDLLSH
ncbi:UAA transporter [Gossypium australe]|uniref:UAA transporter n=1 Tax=Gossypium australe TaxID=47621 RepID=A0A5B6UT97_9ROSI|nr:UAA transporter [Gossypium australe]